MLCHFSSRDGKEMLSNRSKTVRRSNGGKNSQSSWYELLLEKEAFRDRMVGVGGEDEAFGVLMPEGGDSLLEDVAEPLVGVLAISGERLSLGRIRSELGRGLPAGSDMLRACCRNVASSGCLA